MRKSTIVKEVELLINKKVAGNSWVKENVKTLEELNY